MKEAEFQRWVIDLARLKGWRVAHFTRAQVSGGRWVTPVAADGAGWPDLCLVRRGRIVFMELKASGVRRVRPEQRLWLDALTGCGLEAHVFNPADRARIEEVLA